VGERDGQVALVTGGGRGIGRAISQALAAAGAAVAVTARTAAQVEETAALITQNGGLVLAHAADVTDQAAMEAVVCTRLVLPGMRRPGGHTPCASGSSCNGNETKCSCWLPPHEMGRKHHAGSLGARDTRRTH